MSEQTPTQSPRQAAVRTRMVVAVAGNPNSGKTTLFNALTGLRMKVANYPGVTVEKREARLVGTDIELLDLPGAYSLSARSPDEEIARDIIQGRIEGVARPDAMLVIVDASNLARNLYLATQIIEFGRPVVVVCNMMDMAEARGLAVDCERLAEALGAPVIPAAATEGRGIEAIRRALCELASRPGEGPSFQRTWSLPAALEGAVDRLAARMELAGVANRRWARAGALLWVTDYLCGDAGCRRSAERYLSRLSSADAEAFRTEAATLTVAEPDAASAAVEARYGWIAGLVSKAVGREGAGSPGSAAGMTDRVDRVVTHRFAGPAIFAGVMMLLFASIFWGAEPLMDAVDGGQRWLAVGVGRLIADGPLRSLIADGVIAGVGAVLVFFPQICMLFFFLGILEDSGYMARAAFLMDRLMGRVGLHGKSFIPLLSSYACAIPGILATRTIEDRRDRLTTILVAPLMSCSARLPVYVIVIAAVFGGRTMLKAGVMFSMYLLGTVTALGMAVLFKRTVFAGPRPPFIMELPPYHLPRLGGLVRSTWDRSKLFLTNAGTAIFAACVVIWALSYFPRTDPADFSPETKARLAALDEGDTDARAKVIAGERLRRSYIGRLGHAIEPAIKPLGFDWRIGIGILSSFLAREVFVGTMGITFAVGEADEQSTALRDALASTSWPEGGRVLTPLTGVGLMVFYVLACQCVSTLAVVRKETGSWWWPALMFAYMSVLAYAGALAVYQLGRWTGLGG